MNELLKEYTAKLLRYLGASDGPLLDSLVFLTDLAVVIGSLWFMYILIQRMQTKILLPLSKKFKKTMWYQQLHETTFFNQVSKLIPLLISRMLIPSFLSDLPILTKIIEVALNTISIWLAVSAWNSFISILIQTSKKRSSSSSIAIISVLQLARVLSYIMASLGALSIVLDLNIGAIFSYLGALTAVIILIFKDTILGFVAGLQISASQSIKTGDWIEIPNHKVDGEVLEITLVSTKIRNWDHTIMVVPTHTLISETIKNWQGMKDSKVRRIKRTLFIDVTSIKYCTPEMIEHCRKIPSISRFIKLENKPKTLTNLELFRGYLQSYLYHNDHISNRHIRLVRPLENGRANGLPLEIYCFSVFTEWVKYEGVLARVMEYAFASSTLFELEPYQEPSGYDLKHLIKTNQNQHIDPTIS